MSDTNSTEMRPAKTDKLVRVNGVLVYTAPTTLPSGVDFTAEAREHRISELVGRNQIKHQEKTRPGAHL